MATKNEMIMASQDLQTAFGLEPPLNMQGTWQELLAGLLEFKAEMTPQEINQMKPATHKLLQALNVETIPPVAKKPPAKGPVKVEAPEFREPEKAEETKPVEAKPEKKAKTPVKGKVPAVKKETPVKKPGIISTIVQLIEKAGKEGITKEAILAGLVKEFPEREAKSMKNTINVQVPARINKERFKVENLGNGLYRKA